MAHGTYAGTFQSIWGIFRKLRFHSDIQKWPQCYRYDRGCFLRSRTQAQLCCVPFTYQSLGSVSFFLASLDFDPRALNQMRRFAQKNIFAFILI